MLNPVKWIACAMTAALLAANLVMPINSVCAYGADTSIVSETASAAEEDTAQEQASQSALTEQDEQNAASPEDSASSEDTDSRDTSNSTDAAESNDSADSAEDDLQTDPGETLSDESGLEDSLSDSPVLSDPSAASEILAEEELPVLTADPDTESVIPDEGGTDSDNDYAFNGYVNREMGLSDDLAADTGSTDITKKTLKKSYASSRLSGNNRIVYDLLLAEIKKVAAGERTDTIFTVTTADLDVADQYWTAEELGVDVIVADGAITDEAKTALKNILGVSYTAINRALLADCPYDLYWYDKTAESKSTGFGYSAEAIDGEYVLSFSNYYDYTFSFPVSAEYSASGEELTYEMNADVGASVLTAYENARSIVDKYADYSDHEKLTAYKNEICDLTSYNSAAAYDTDTSYGNPWQLIWIFDGDDSTKVVCEGYSKGFQYLCDLTDWEENSIFNECISVTGKLNNSGHMWNIVSLYDGRSYLADITNCDDGTIGSGDGRSRLFLVGTGDSCAAGSVEDGYIFSTLSNLTYTYDTTARDRFGDEILTLAEGRVDEKIDLAEEAEKGNIDISITEPEDGFVYTGEEITPAVSVSYRGTLLTQGSEYTVSCTDNTNAGTATCLVEGAGAYIGIISLPFTIQKASQTITAEDVTLTSYASADVIVSGNKTTLHYTSEDPSVFTVDESTGTITGVSPGTAALTITAEETDNYPAASAQINVTVEPLELTQEDTSVSLGAYTFTYNGTAKTPTVTKVVDVNGRTLVKNTDFTVSYSNNINAGTNKAKVIVTGTGCYTGTVVTTFTIKKAVQNFSLRIGASSLAVGRTTSIIVTGAKGTRTFVSSNPSIATAVKSDYSICKVTGKKVGTTTITVTAAECYNYLEAKKTITVTVLPAATTSLTAVNLAGGIKLNWARVTDANAYFIYRNNKLIKTVKSGSTVTFTDTGATSNGTKYVYKITANATTGKSTLSRTVTIYRLSRPAISSLKNSSSRKMTLTWAKNSQASGYQIQYSLYSNLRSVKTVSVPSPTTVSKTIGSLTKGKTYYVRMRTYKKVGTATYCSAWSALRSVKISK